MLSQRRQRPFRTYLLKIQAMIRRERYVFNLLLGERRQARGPGLEAEHEKAAALQALLETTRLAHNLAGSLVEIAPGVEADFSHPVQQMVLESTADEPLDAALAGKDQRMKLRAFLQDEALKLGLDFFDALL